MTSMIVITREKIVVIIVLLVGCNSIELEDIIFRDSIFQIILLKQEEKLQFHPLNKGQYEM